MRGDAPGRAARDRGRSSSALAPATANSSVSTANLTSIARPQSVSTKPRQAGTWTNKLSNPATASTGTVPAAISEKRRTDSVCSARRSRGEPAWRPRQSAQTSAASMPIQRTAAAACRASKSVAQIQPSSMAAPWLTLARLAMTPAATTTSARFAGCGSRAGPRRAASRISVARSSSAQRTSSQRPTRVSKRISSRKWRPPNFVAAEAAA